eukprot:scaffold273_cov242-Pinguiococcus_pyrenoidosus.AAC.12
MKGPFWISVLVNLKFLHTLQSGLFEAYRRQEAGGRLRRCLCCPRAASVARGCPVEAPREHRERPGARAPGRVRGRNIGLVLPQTNELLGPSARPDSTFSHGGGSFPEGSRRLSPWEVQQAAGLPRPSQQAALAAAGPPGHRLSRWGLRRAPRRASPRAESHGQLRKHPQRGGGAGRAHCQPAREQGVDSSAARAAALDRGDARALVQGGV